MSTHKQASEELEAQLAKDLGHTLKLVPQSQRELFVFELARYVTERDKKRDAYIIGEDENPIRDANGNLQKSQIIRNNNYLRAQQRKRSEEVI